jgi:putative phage-type endonuclease
MNALMNMDNGLSPLRVGRLTGSRVAAALGLNPYNSRADVLREMVREHFGAEREFTGNEATRWGQDHEPQALALYEAQAGVMTYGGGELLIHPAHDFLAVTPDGLVGDDGMIECKAPYRGKYSTLAEVPYYAPQVQLQLAVTGRKWCDFVVWRDGAISVDRIAADPFWLPSVLPALAAFMADYAAALAAPDAHLADKERSDKAWRDAADDYLGALAALNDLEAIVKAKREALLALAGDATAKGCGVQVIRSERAGSVAYAKALKDLAPDADLTPYTGKPTTVFTVKEYSK